MQLLFTSNSLYLFAIFTAMTQKQSQLTLRFFFLLELSNSFINAVFDSSMAQAKLKNHQEVQSTVSVTFYTQKSIGNFDKKNTRFHQSQEIFGDGRSRSC